MSITIGVDPGGRTTAIVAVDTTTSEPVALILVKNTGDLLPLPADYLRAVAADVNRMASEHGAELVRVEGVTRPSWHVGGKAKGAATNPTGLLGAAQVLGAVVAATTAPVEVIPPGRNGSLPNARYPVALVGEGERRRPGWETRTGTGQLRHARSAYDVALGGARARTR